MNKAFAILLALIVLGVASSFAFIQSSYDEPSMREPALGTPLADRDMAAPRQSAAERMQTDNIFSWDSAADKALYRFHALSREDALQMIGRRVSLRWHSDPRLVSFMQKTVSVSGSGESLQTVLRKVIAPQQVSLLMTCAPSAFSNCVVTVSVGALDTSLPDDHAVDALGDAEDSQSLMDARLLEASFQEYDQHYQQQRENFPYASSKSRIEILNELPTVSINLPLVVGALKSDNDVEVRANAAVRLASYDNFTATRALLDAITDRDERVATAALVALQLNRDDSVLSEISNQLALRKSNQLNAAAQQLNISLLP